jgi:hypothetical protein
MPYNWGPNFIVPSEALKYYSGIVMLREEYDEELLKKELQEHAIARQSIVDVTVKN